jgi:hypothetical protein
MNLNLGLNSAAAQRRGMFAMPSQNNFMVGRVAGISQRPALPR